MDEVLEQIRQRQSDRVPFDEGRMISSQDLRKILDAGRWAPTAHNMQNFEVVVVDDRILLGAIAAIRRPISEIFVRENYAQLSFSEQELMQKKVGLLGTMFPPFMRTPDAPTPAEGSPPFLPTPLLLVVLYDPRRRAPASEGDFLGIISLGCVMENMWLVAESLGIGFHIVSSLSSPEVAKEVKRILDVPENLRVAFSCRLGYPAAARGKYLRVRRDIDGFVHRNRFGTGWRT
jgi:nitroreductase